jgi:hypothetical protein
MSFEDQKMLKAADIVKNPQLVDQIRGRYQTIFDATVGLKSLSFDNFDRATKIMAEKGWKAISISGNVNPANPLTGGAMLFVYGLLEKTQ